MMYNIEAIFWAQKNLSSIDIFDKNDINKDRCIHK